MINFGIEKKKCFIEILNKRRKDMINKDMVKLAAPWTIYAN
jgi:hypothetical protein